MISNASAYPDLQKAAAKLSLFTTMIRELTELSHTMELPAFYEEVVARTGYANMLQAKNDIESRTRLENVKELLTSINGYVENAEGEPTLNGFLDEVALYTDIDNHDPNEDAVVMMTMHSAKGLEFPHVFLVGFEDGLFPGMRSIGDEEEMEEERRLAYVAITRARKTLDLCHARQRMLYGRTNSALASRFLKEIPEEYIQRKGGSRFQTERPAYGQTGYGGGYGGSRPVSAQNAARQAQIKKSQQSSLTASATSTAPVRLELSKGDMVQHKAFGKGMVLTANPVGGDVLLEIAFDGVGTKRLFANTASVHMKKL